MLATVKAWQIMLGKIIGLGATGLLQFTVIGAIAILGIAVDGAVLRTDPDAGAFLARRGRRVADGGRGRLTIVAIGVMALVGGRVYANSVLRTGARVKLREAFSRTG